ncbi:MAG: hypothetical protein Q4P08_05060, partial [Eubacteriales bacterium]|nr:hypothetical protein [Eubacteriales bacterium]
MIRQLKSILKYDLLYFFRYKTNLIWLIATPLVFSLTGAFLSLLLGKDKLMEAIGGEGSGTLYVLIGYLVFSFANYGWQINNKIEREMSLGTLQYNFLLPYKKQLYIYGLCLGTIFSNGIFSGVLLLIVFIIKGSSIASILWSIMLLILVLIVYLGISLI